MRIASRPKRWAATIAELQAIDASELESLKDEYEEWLANLPENLTQSPVSEKLEATVEAADAVLYAIEDLTAALSEAEGVDLPLGFGRD
jgi:hypothetical protein